MAQSEQEPYQGLEEGVPSTIGSPLPNNLLKVWKKHFPSEGSSRCQKKRVKDVGQQKQQMFSIRPLAFETNQYPSKLK